MHQQRNGWGLRSPYDRHGDPLRGQRTDPGVARQSVNVNAIVFGLVWNAEKSILEVADFIEAITLSAQTALRGGEHPQNCVAQNHR